MNEEEEEEMDTSSQPPPPPPILVPSVINPGDEITYPQLQYPHLPGGGMEDWQYVMRRTMQEIVPGLYLGPYGVATKNQREQLLSAGITHIVCVREIRERKFIRTNFPDDFIYLVVELEDNSYAPLIPHLRRVNPFIGEALTNGGKVLVHGSAGISRSAALVIAYIMERFGTTASEAQKYVSSIRFCCNPNEGFISQLREFEFIYRSKHTFQTATLPPLPGRNANLKRSFGDDDEEYDPDAPNKEGRGTLQSNTS